MCLLGLLCGLHSSCVLYDAHCVTHMHRICLQREVSQWKVRLTHSTQVSSTYRTINFPIFECIKTLAGAADFLDSVYRNYTSYLVGSY